MEVLDILNLAGLGDSVTFLLEPLLFVKLERAEGVLEIASEEQETTDKGSSSALPVVAVHYAHVARGVK